MSSDPLGLAAAATALSVPMVRLIDAVEKGVGAWARPWMMKRIARANVDVKLIEAKGATKVAAATAPADLEIPVHIDWEQLRTPEDRAAVRVDQLEARRQRNIEQVISTTAASLSEEAPTDAGSKTVDPDWAAQFFDAAKDVSSLEMQAIWSKLLDGEVRRPGEFSIRTIHALRQMSTAEAALFLRLAPYITIAGSGPHILEPDSVQRLSGVTFKDRLLLSELGLLHSNDLMWNITGNGSRSTCLAYRDLVVCLQVPDKKTITLDVVGAGIAGGELARLIAPRPSTAYLRCILDAVREAGANATVHPLKSIGDDGKLIYDESERVPIDVDEGGEP